MEDKELNREFIRKTLGQGDDRYYVYMLCNAKNGVPFYIGKGEGGRIWQHEEDAHAEEEEIEYEVKKFKAELNKSLSDKEKKEQLADFRTSLKNELSKKHQKINSLGRDNVTKVIVKWGLTEQEAYMAESALINMCKFYEGGLTNIVNGHMSQKEKDNRYCKTEAQTLEEFETNCAEPEKSLTDILKVYFGEDYTKKTAKDGCGILFVKINNFYPMCEAIENAADKDAAIRDAASGFWKVEREHDKIEYVFALYKSQIVGIYYVKNATWVRKRNLGPIKIIGNSAKSAEGNLPFALGQIRRDEYDLVNKIGKNWDNYDRIKGTSLEDKLKNVLGRYNSNKTQRDDEDYANALRAMGDKYMFIPKPEDEIPKDNAFWKIRDAFLHKYINIPATKNSIYYNFNSDKTFRESPKSEETN